nr:unnamed protein product [Naegleria fowleri]
MYFGDKQKRWSQFQRGQESSSFVTIPCFGPNSFLSLSQVTECQLSHLKYNVSNTGVILSSEFIYENDNLKDVTSMEWYQLITQSFNISSQKGFENVIHLPLRQKYSMWSDVVESSKELSTFVSLLVRDPVNGSFVGVAALEYGLAELHDYMSSVLDIPHAVIKIFHEIQEEEESFRFNHTNVKLTVQNRLNGTTVLYDYSISIIISDNIVLKAIVITEHFQFFVSTINNSVTGWIILILILSLCIVVLLIVLKTITHPLHRLSKKMTNMLHLDRALSVKVEPSSLLGDVKIMETALEKFRKALLYFSLIIPEHIVRNTLTVQDESELFSPKRQFMSLIVLELNGFNEFQQHVGNAVFSNVLRKLITEVTTAIHYNEGFVLDMSIKNGIKLFACWNDESAPIENHEIRATAATLEINKMIDDSIEMIKHEWNHPTLHLSFRTAIATGFIDIGLIGSINSRINIACFGEVVAVGDLLLEQCGNNEVVLCENVYRKVQHMFLCYFLQKLPYQSTLRNEKYSEMNVYVLKKYLKESNAGYNVVLSPIDTYGNVVIYLIPIGAVIMPLDDYLIGEARLYQFYPSGESDTEKKVKALLEKKIALYNEQQNQK